MDRRAPIRRNPPRGGAAGDQLDHAAAAGEQPNHAAAAGELQAAVPGDQGQQERRVRDFLQQDLDEIQEGINRESIV